MNKTVSKEGVLVVLEDGAPTAMIRRDEKTGHQVLFEMVEMGAEQIEALLS